MAAFGLGIAEELALALGLALGRATALADALRKGHCALFETYGEAWRLLSPGLEGRTVRVLWGADAL